MALIHIHILVPGGGVLCACGTSHGCQGQGARASEAGAGREKVYPTKHRGTAERERSTAPELH